MNFSVVDRLTREFSYRKSRNASEIADQSINELNARFLENGVGYQYEAGEIIRVDSQFVHSEVVKPTFKLLAQPGYAGAQPGLLFFSFRLCPQNQEKDHSGFYGRFP